MQDKIPHYRAFGGIPNLYLIPVFHRSPLPDIEGIPIREQASCKGVSITVSPMNRVSPTVNWAMTDVTNNASTPQRNG